MNKVARKPSSDPNQEKLRENKAKWNKDVTIFINDLIHFKKMMNGWPSKFNMQRSKIQDPIPADPATIIGSLAQDFADLAQRGNSIIQEQLDYSKTRRKKSPQAPKSPGVDLSKQLSLPLTSSEFSDYNLISEGSSPWSRIKSRILNMTFSADEDSLIKKMRMSWLSDFVNFHNNLKKFQNIVLSFGDQSNYDSYVYFRQLKNDWIDILKKVEQYQSSHKKEQEKLEQNKPVQENGSENKKIDTPAHDSDVDRQAGEAIQDFINNARNFYDLDFGNMNQLIKAYYKADDAGKLTFSPAIVLAYQNILQQANKKFNLNEKSLLDIYNKLHPSKEEGENLESTSQAVIKEMIHKFKSSSVYKLEINNKIKKIKRAVDAIMDSLEKSMSMNELEPLIKEASELIMSIDKIITILYSPRGEDVGIGPGLSDKEKQKLIEQIQRMRAREFAHKYKA